MTIDGRALRSAPSGFTYLRCGSLLLLLLLLLLVPLLLPLLLLELPARVESPERRLLLRLLSRWLLDAWVIVLLSQLAPVLLWPVLSQSVLLAELPVPVPLALLPDEPVPEVPVPAWLLLPDWPLPDCPLLPVPIWPLVLVPDCPLVLLPDWPLPVWLLPLVVPICPLPEPDCASAAVLTQAAAIRIINLLFMSASSKR